MKALKAAFPHTIPIFAGFWFLGLAYGIYMNASGFSFWYPMLMSLTIFGGSLEFVAVSMLLAPFAPLQTFVMTLMIQARHLFYGISMLDRFKGMGWKKYYLIFGMCSEQIITVALCVAGTMTTRFLPFVVFSSKRPTPKYVQYLGKVLPGAIFGMLVVYCLKDVSIINYSHGIPEAIAIVSVC